MDVKELETTFGTPDEFERICNNIATKLLKNKNMFTKDEWKFIIFFMKKGGELVFKKE